MLKHNCFIKVLILNILLIASAITFAQNRNTVDSLKNIIAETSKDTVKIQAYIDLSVEYESFNLDTALYYSDTALKKSLKTNCKKGIADAYKQKGVIAILLNKYKHADSLLNIAVSIYRDINYQIGIMLCYNYLSVSADNKGENRLSLAYCMKALKIAEDTSLFRYRAQILSSIGIAYTNLGDYEKAIENGLLSLKIYEQFNNKKMIAGCNVNIGVLFKQINDFDNSFKYMNKALKLFIELEHTSGQSTCLTNIGNIYRNQKKYDEALQNYIKALELEQINNNLDGISTNYNNIGNVYYELKKYDKAAEYYNKSLEINEQIGDKRGIATAYFNIAEIKIKQKEYKLAEKYCLKSTELFEQSDDLDKHRKALEQLTKIYNLTGKYKKAFNTQNKAIAIKDSLFNIEKAQKIAQIEEKYLNEKLEKQIIELNCENNLQQTEIFQYKKLRNIYLIAFVFAAAAIIIIFIQYRKKNNAYRFLVRKNIDLLLKEKGLKNNKEELQSNYQNKTSQITISETEKEKILNKMTKLLDTDRIFNNFDLTCDKFAKQLSTNRFYLSQIINEKFGKNYSDFINEYRVKEVMLMLSDPVKTKQFSIEAIAKEAGFKNISSFNRIFKKFTGVTPSIFVNKR